MPPVALPPDDARERAEKALDEAHRLDDKLMDIIRDELHASTDHAPAPPAPPAKPNRS